MNDCRQASSLGFDAIHLNLLSFESLGDSRAQRVAYLRLAHAHNPPMLPWKVVTTNQAVACTLNNASIWWTNDVGAIHATGRVELQCIPEVPGLFRIVIDGTMVLWNKEDKSKQQGPPIKHCLYLPTDGDIWTVSAARTKSIRRPDNKVFAVAVQFDPSNKDGISFLQVCVQVMDAKDLANGETFAEAIKYANTSIERRPDANKNYK